MRNDCPHDVRFLRIVFWVLYVPSIGSNLFIDRFVPADRGWQERWHSIEAQRGGINKEEYDGLTSGNNMGCYRRIAACDGRRPVRLARSSRGNHRPPVVTVTSKLVADD